MPVGARITVTSVIQAGSTITVNGTGFSSLTVINFFNRGLHLGGLGTYPNIPLTLIDSTQVTFTKPSGSVAGAGLRAGAQPALPNIYQFGDGPWRRLHAGVTGGVSGPYRDYAK